MSFTMTTTELKKIEHDRPYQVKLEGFQPAPAPVRGPRVVDRRQEVAEMGSGWIRKADGRPKGWSTMIRKIYSKTGPLLIMVYWRPKAKAWKVMCTEFEGSVPRGQSFQRTFPTQKQACEWVDAQVW